MKNFNYISGLIFVTGILLGLVGILLPLFVYKNTSTFYVPKAIDSRSLKFTKNIAWNERFSNKSSDLYRAYQNEIVSDVNDALDGRVGEERRKKRETAESKKNYEIKEVELLSLQKSIDNKVLVFVSVIYVAENDENIPEAENEAKKLIALKNVSNIEGADSSSTFCDPDNDQTTVAPTTTTIITTTKGTTITETSASSVISSKTTASTSILSTIPFPTTTPTILSTTLTPFIPMEPIANCSSNAKYVFQDLVFVYELNNDGNNKLQESEGIQNFVSNVLLNPYHFTFNQTKNGIQAMKLLILPYPNPRQFYSETPSFNSINSTSDLKDLFKQQLLIANSNDNQSLPETGVCYFLSNLNNQRRGLPTTLFLFSKNVPMDFDVLSSCLTELRKTEMNIILVGVGTWDQTEFANLCKNCYYKINVDINNNNEETIAEQIIHSLSEFLLLWLIIMN